MREFGIAELKSTDANCDRSQYWLFIYKGDPMTHIYYILTILVAYLIGSSNMSYYISKLKKVDIKGRGSQNLGASNTVILMGWRAGVLVGAHDIAKGVLAVLLANAFFDLPYIGAVAGVSCILGHIFPFYLKFKGGKGFAPFIGVAFALNWKWSLILAAFIIAAILITDYLVVGTTLTVILVPAVFGITEHSLILSGILLIATVIIVAKHWENYVRIFKGEEYRLLKAFTKERYGGNQ